MSNILTHPTAASVTIMVSVTHFVECVLADRCNLQVFDWLLMFEMEYSLIWKAKWNATKILYLIVRYLPFIDTTLVMCRKALFAFTIGPQLTLLHTRASGVHDVKIALPKGPSFRRL